MSDCVVVVLVWGAFCCCFFYACVCRVSAIVIDLSCMCGLESVKKNTRVVSCVLYVLWLVPCLLFRVFALFVLACVCFVCF